MTTSTPARSTEHTYSIEQVAKDVRRELIAVGYTATLIGYDVERDVYAFNVEEPAIDDNDAEVEASVDAHDRELDEMGVGH